MANNDPSIELTRRRLLGGLAGAGVASAGAGAGTFAFFSDSSTSTGNSMSAGTIDLTIDSTYSYPWSISGAKPGDPDASDHTAFTYGHAGSIQASSISFGFVNHPHEDDDGDGSNYTPGPSSDESTDAETGADGFSRYVYVDSLRYTRQDPDGNNIETTTLVQSRDPTTAGSDITMSNGAFVSLYDLEQNTNGALTGFNPPTLGGQTVTWEIGIGVHPSLDDRYQGDVLETDVLATLKQ